MDMSNPLLKNVKLTNIEQHKNEFIESIKSFSIDDKINSQLHTKDKVFANTHQPTMSMDEFADMQMTRAAEHEQKSKEYQDSQIVDQYDEEKDFHVDIKKKEEREWDDWKDTVEKGSGNKGGR
jgi:hypothetical protein